MSALVMVNKHQKATLREWQNISVASLSAERHDGCKAELLGPLPEAVLVLLLAAHWRGYHEILFVTDFSLLSVTALV